MIVTIGVNEHIVLKHEIEIEVDEGSEKHIQDFLREIEGKGLDDVEEYQKSFNGIEVLDKFIEEVPDEKDVSYESWIINVVS